MSLPTSAAIWRLRLRLPPTCRSGRRAATFAPASEFQPLLHLWSLGIEEQFYLVWPLVLYFAWRRKYSVLHIVVFLTAASFAANLVLTHVDATAAFYFPLSRFWELGLGCSLAILASASHGRPMLSPRVSRYTPAVGAALIALSLFLFDRKTAFPGVAAVVPTLGALAILIPGEDSWFRNRVLASRPMVFVGLISYPLYLWHWPIVSFEAILHSGTTARPLPLGRGAVEPGICNPDLPVPGIADSAPTQHICGTWARG